MLQSPFAPPACRFCSAPLDTAGDDICDNFTCQTRLRHEEALAARKIRMDRHAALERERHARVAEILTETAARAGGTLDEVAHAVVPHTSFENKPLPDERRAAFEAHLDEMIACGFGPEGDALNEEAEKTHAARETLDPDEGLALDLSCIACRGYCCLLGGPRHAFIEAKTIAYFRHREPEATPDEVREAYLSRLPEVSLESGCVFQGEKGCTLPRTMRAEICNEYQCNYRVQLLREIEKKGSERVAVVALSRDHREHPEPNAPIFGAASLNAEGQLELHDDFELPALPDSES